MTVFSEPGFDPATLDAGSVQLGDGAGGEAAPYQCSRGDHVNGDRVRERVCAFEPASVRAAVPTTGPQSLILRGRYTNGGTLFLLRAADAINRL